MFLFDDLMRFENITSKIIWLLRVVRWIGILIPILSFIFFFELYFDLNGVRAVHYDFDPTREKQIIHSFEPGNRIFPTEKRLSNGRTYRRFSDEPVYFQVSMPRLYESIELELVYSNPSQNIIELGLQKGKKDNFQFTFQPVENRIIDEIQESLDWQKLIDENRGIALFQKENIFFSVEDFLNNPPYERPTVFYRAPLAADVKLANYVPATERSRFDIALKGSYTFFTYAKDEDIDISFEFQDVDLQTGSDPVTIQLWRGNELLKTSQILDEAESFGLTQDIPARKIFKLQYAQAPEGVYKIVFVGTEDIIIRSIDTAQHLLVVENRLSLADGTYLKRILNDLPAQPTSLYSDIPQLRIRALREGALGDIEIDRDIVRLDEIRTFVLWERPLRNEKVYPLIISDEVELIGRGFFSLTPESFFDPNGQVAPLDVHTDPKFLDFFLVGDYNSPVSRGIWKIVSVSFPINKDNIYEGNTLRFILSAPELGNLRDDILISDIKAVLRKTPFSLGEFFKRFSL